MTQHLNISDSQSRACVLCFEIKPASAFYRRETGRLRRDCKDCQRSGSTMYQQSEAGRESVRKAGKKYRATGRHAKNNRQWRERNPIKWKAAGILAWRIKTGEVIRPDRCESCRVECIPHGHHSDYLKPLDVDWLCVRCHAAWHVKHGAALNG